MGVPPIIGGPPAGTLPQVRTFACAALLVLVACSGGGDSDRAAPAATPRPTSTYSPPPPPTFPTDPPVMRDGFKRIVVGDVGLGIPRRWTACKVGVVAAGLNGPELSIGPQAPTAPFNPMSFQVDPAPGDKLIDGKYAIGALRERAFPDADERIGEIEVPNAIQTLATRYTTRAPGLELAGFDALAMGANETRVRLSWISRPGRWERIEPLFRDVARSVDFEVRAAPTPLGSCPR